MTFIWCQYKRTGYIGGHWCNECPPIKEYNAILKQEELAFRERNKKLREKNKYKKPNKRSLKHRVLS